MLTTATRLKYAAEPFAGVIEEAKPLLAEHWKEIAVYKDIPLDPDYAFYAKLSEIGALVVYTVRDEAPAKEDGLGILIGYSVFVLRPHAHYRAHRWALNDLVWLHPGYRQLNVGRGLVKYWDADLKDRGVNVVHVNAKVQHPALAFLLKEEGYDVVEAGYEKRLG